MPNAVRKGKAGKFGGKASEGRRGQNYPLLRLLCLFALFVSLISTPLDHNPSRPKYTIRNTAQKLA